MPLELHRDWCYYIAYMKSNPIESYGAIALGRCHVNLILEELCNRIKKIISIPSKVRCAIALARETELIPSNLNYGITLERLSPSHPWKSYGAIFLGRCRVNPILEDLCNRTRKTMSIPVKVSFAIVLGRLSWSLPC
jgi:hypothetical protein